MPLLPERRMTLSAMRRPVESIANNAPSPASSMMQPVTAPLHFSSATAWRPAWRMLQSRDAKLGGFLEMNECAPSGAGLTFWPSITRPDNSMLSARCACEERSAARKLEPRRAAYARNLGVGGERQFARAIDAGRQQQRQPRQRGAIDGALQGLRLVGRQIRLHAEFGGVDAERGIGRCRLRRQSASRRRRRRWWRRR